MKSIIKKEIIGPIIIAICCVLLCVIATKIVNKIFKLKSIKINEGRKRTVINLINNIIRFIVVLLGILMILEIYGIDTKALIASFGIVGVIAGLAMQDVLKDFISGISMIFDCQYSIGDIVTINGFKGEVIPSNLRTIKLKSYSGEIKIISNRNVTEIINHSVEYKNMIIDVDIAYESDIDKVILVLNDLCLNIKKEYNLSDAKCLGIQEMSVNSIKIRIVFEVDYSLQFDIEREIKKRIILLFNKHKIVIPYNQLVIHNG